MLKIDQRQQPKPGSPNLIVNGIVDEESYIIGNIQNGTAHACVYSDTIAKILLSCRISDLDPHFASLEIPYKLERPDFLRAVKIQLVDPQSSQRRRRRRIAFELQPDWEEWARSYSIAEFAEAFEQSAKERLHLHVSYFQSDTYVSNGFGVECKISSGRAVIEKELNRCAEILIDICDNAEKLLASKARKNAVTTFFQFPAEVRTACEQYLLYFIQFLEDMGIKATAEIKNDANRVLFSVTPADGPAALEQIRQTLEIYLALPGMPDFEAESSHYPNLAVQQLQANVLHLRSQLVLSSALLQAKDATIEALQVANYQYKQLLSSENKPAEKSVDEPLIGDTVHVTKVETKGLKVGLPLILRRLKRVFGIGKNNAPPLPQPALQIRDSDSNRPAS